MKVHGIIFLFLLFSYLLTSCGFSVGINDVFFSLVVNNLDLLPIPECKNDSCHNFVVLKNQAIIKKTL